MHFIIPWHSDYVFIISRLPDFIILFSVSAQDDNDISVTSELSVVGLDPADLRLQLAGDLGNNTSVND